MRKSCLWLLCLCLWLSETIAEMQTGRLEEEDEDEALHMIGLRLAVNCTDREAEFAKMQHSNYWTLINYVPANHGRIRCATSVTYTTHGDYRYLSNVAPLVERWRAPISLALYAPGTDFKATVHSIMWLQQCAPERELIKRWVSFHIYFHVEHMPDKVYAQKSLGSMKVKCTRAAPFDNVPQSALYRSQHELDYPINVGRNIAKQASLTHYILASDIELYPTPGLVDGFLKMLTANMHLVNTNERIVYPLNIFEVHANATMPSTKMELKSQLATGEAIPFHTHVCPQCNMAQNLPVWINQTDNAQSINVFSISKRLNLWDPIYIGTIHDPEYDERLSWEGMSDKMVHSYALCLMDYSFLTLDNAFLVHKPGIKMGHTDPARLSLAAKIYKKIRNRFLVEYLQKYGYQEGCTL